MYREGSWFAFICHAKKKEEEQKPEWEPIPLYAPLPHEVNTRPDTYSSRDEDIY